MAAFGFAGVWDEILNDGTKIKRWDWLSVDGKSHTWIYNSASRPTYYGHHAVYADNLIANLGGVSAASSDALALIAIRYDGVPLKWGAVILAVDATNTYNGDWHVSVSPAYTGWNTSYVPSSDEIKAYFNGWQVNGYSVTGTVTDEPTGLLADQATYTFANAGKYKDITVTKSTDDITYTAAEEGVDYELSNLDTTAVLKNISGTSLYFKISYSYGVTANSWVGLDGTTPTTNDLSYVSTTTLRDQNPNTWWKPYVIIYQLKTPQIEQLEARNTLRTTTPTHNYIVFTDEKVDTFTGDGVTTTFNLTYTATNTNYNVYVNGELQTEGVTKSSTSVTFDTPPANGAIIEVRYNPNDVPAALQIEVYEPSGTQETIGYFDTLQVNEVAFADNWTTQMGIREQKVKSRWYEITLNKNWLENYEAFLNKYRDKKFRLIVTNTRSSETEYYAMCEIVRSSADKMAGTENIVIRCRNYYPPV